MDVAAAIHYQRKAPSLPAGRELGSCTISCHPCLGCSIPPGERRSRHSAPLGAMLRLLGEGDSPRAIYGAPSTEPQSHLRSPTRALSRATPGPAHPPSSGCFVYVVGEGGARGGHRCSGNAQILPETPARTAGSCGEFCAALWKNPRSERSCSSTAEGAGSRAATVPRNRSFQVVTEGGETGINTGREEKRIFFPWQGNRS